MKYSSLLAAGLAAFALLGAVAVIEACSHRFERENERRVAESFFPQKLQGSALQRLAFTLPHFLPIYGSSELGAYKRQRVVESKPGDFFIQAPTGFVAFPVGRGGTTPLVILQDIASVGSAARGKKVVIVISPSWFTRPLSAKTYAGNASIMHSGCLLFGDLSDDLKERVSQRLLAFPEVLENSDIVRMEAQWYAANTPSQIRLAHYFQPIGQLWLRWLRLIDDVSTVVEIQNPRSSLTEPPPLERKPVKWAREEAASETISSFQAVSMPPRDSFGNRTLEIPSGTPKNRRPPPSVFANENVWNDYELLLQTLHEVGARPLILCVPLDGQADDLANLPYSSRKLFYNRIRNQAARYSYPTFTFEEHEYDGNFLINHADHLTEKGWLYFDQIINAFYHDKIKS